jgi:NAD(P)-dependent dehydrogenase (short-subunit alcohol dehydrogenase family)
MPLTKSNKPESFPAQEQESQPGKEYIMSPQPEIIRPGYKGSEKLKDKVALITGGDSGIGRSVAVHFAREGADVAISYKPEEQKDADLTKSLIEKEGRRCLCLPGDLKDHTYCKEIVEQTVKNFGKLNILVNNAAEQWPQDSLLDITDEQLECTFNTNIFSFFRVTRAAMPHLKESDCIINSTSITNYKGHEKLIDYSSTKGAITAFTRSLALMLASKKIRVNGVAPGPIWTPLIPASFDKEKVAKFGSDTPLGRAGQPSECGPAYVFLACEDASYFTGQILHPNGGYVVNT